MTTKFHPAARLTDSQIEALVADIADLRWTRQQMEQSHEASRRALNVRIAELTENARPSMERVAEQIANLSVTIDERTATVEAWARAHMTERFSAKRSHECLHGVLRFKLTPPRVEIVKDITWRRVAYWLSVLAGGRKYLNPPTVNREELLKDRAKLEARPSLLRRLGIVFRQDDVFRIDLREVRSDAIHGVEHKEAA